MRLRTNYCFMYVLGKDAREKAQKQFGTQSSPRGTGCPSWLHVNCRGTEVGPSWGCALTQDLGQGQRELSPGFQMNFNRFQQCGLLVYHCEENLFWI